MYSVLGYVRSILEWCVDVPTGRASSKRDRVDDDLSSDGEVPANKKLKQLGKTNFPDMETNDTWAKNDKQTGNFRYVPVQVETGHPSTSTPNESSNLRASKVRTIPLELVGVTENGSYTPRKSKMHTPIRPVMHAVLNNDEDDEVTFVETKPKKINKVYINLEEDNENNSEQQNEDIIYVKKIVPSPPVKPVKFFYEQNDENESRDEVDDVQYYRLKKVNKTNSNSSLRTINKFRAPAGVTKTYKRLPTPMPKWMQGQEYNTSPKKSRFLNLNENGRMTLSEVFNLNQKKRYQELIRRVTGTTHLSNKPIDIINLAEDVASFRKTQRSQKNALSEIKLVEKGLASQKENEVTTEYDPITVASINSSDSEVEVVPSECSTSSSARIDPINSLRDSFKGKAIMADDWLAKLNNKYKKKRQDTNEKLKDARLESDIISKVNYEQKLAHLEHKLKHELSIPESLIEEVQPTVELPKLTVEQEKLVNKVLGPGPSDQVLIEKFNLKISRRDMQTLAGLNWLNDEIINFYMNLLMQRSQERTDLPKVYATNTFFYPKLMQSGQAGLRRWTRKVDIFSHDLIMVPIHLGVHWCMSIIDFRSKSIKYFDSMGARNQNCLNALLQYLRDEHQDKKGQPFDDNGWSMENLKDIPQQMNGSDCGVFACTFAEFISRNAPINFSQAHMPYLRRKAALEIVLGKLLL